MALTKKQRQNLESADKRRARRPEPTVATVKSMKVTKGERDRVTKGKSSMLLRLERLLVDEAERDAEIDDAVISMALLCAVQNTRPHSPIAKPIIDSLMHWREMEDDAETTDVAMRVIYQSIQTRSRCNPGDYDYLMYASSFVKQAVIYSRYAS